MEPFDVSDVLRVTGGKLVAGARNVALTGISTDSRSCCPGDLFVALRGLKFDGNRFAAAALEAGAGAALVEKGKRPEVVPPAKAVVELGDTAEALVDLAVWYRGRFPIPAVAITGSCGKTTTKEILAHLLSRRYRVVRSARSFNNAIGVPLTIFSMDRRTEVAVFEIGTNAPGEIAKLASLTRPTGGIITNVSEAHLQGLGSVEGVFREKAALFEALPQDGFAVINLDDPRTGAKLREMTRATVVGVSCDLREADLFASEVVFHGIGTSFKLNGKYAVTLPMLGTHNVYNALQALASCMALGMELPEALEVLASVPVAAHRLERKRFGSIEVLDDSYNSNPASARAAIRALQGLRGTKRKVLILGDMLELGQRGPELHFEIGDAVAAAGVDLFIAVGAEGPQMVKGALAGGMPTSRVLLFSDTKSAVLGIAEILQPEDLVLVKGSRRLALETIVDALAEKFAAPSPQAPPAGGVAVAVS